MSTQTRIPQAVRHASRNKFSVEVAGQDDLVSLVASGCPVEEAGADDQAEQQEAQQ